MSACARNCLHQSPHCGVNRCPNPTDRFSSFDDVLNYLNGLGLFHMNMGLERMEHALQTLQARRMPCPVVQVAGTNGKGSTSVFLQSLASAHGFRTGLYTSPHFLSPIERIRMGSRALPESAWPALASRALQAEPDLTYFELLTVMAALAFQDAEPDLLIFETGLGGRYDATSALAADMVCYTPIDLDHMEVLGPDLASIAADKADAMRPGMFAAVSAAQPAEAWEAIRRKAEALNIPLCNAEQSATISETLLSPALRPLLALVETAELGLHGPHQRHNARTALTAWLMLCQQQKWNSDERAILRGLKEAFLPGRLHAIASHGLYPAFLLDGAHNPHGMTALRDALSASSLHPRAVIFSCLADKQPDTLLTLVRELAGDAPVFIPAIADNPRAARAIDLARKLGPQARSMPNLHEAITAASQAETVDTVSPVLVCGSLYLLSEFFSLFPDALHQREIPSYAL